MKARNQRRRWANRRISILILYLLVPALMGGCPEFRNESITAIETATRGVLDAALDLFFDQFRTDDF